MNHDPIMMRHRLFGASVLGLSLVLAGCGGGGSSVSEVATSDAAPVAGAPAATDTVPGATATSTSALIAYELALKPDDRSEPLNIGNLVLPTDDRAEPTPIGI